ncbi:SgcJ/EcaC family oxidoreductase [Erythrobacter sp. A30-3]|nr:SgcJ/EcaC family oxidoreductase [Erythrobacter sp. A30-3]
MQGFGRFLTLAAIIAWGGIAQAQEVVEDDQINYLTGDPASWPAELEATVAAPHNHKVLLENDQVRVLEVTLAPGEVEPLHFHRWPSVLYIQQAEEWIDRDAYGQVIFDSRKVPPMEFPLTMWKGPEAPHSPVNLSDSVEVRLIRVEIKGGDMVLQERSDLSAFAQRYAQAWSSQDPDKVAAFFSPDGQLAINGDAPAKGRQEIAAAARGFMEAFPDMVVALDRLERSGERLLFHWTLTGTNTGPGGTGASVRISGTEAWLIAPDGLIGDSIGSFDAQDYARQLARGDLHTQPTVAEADQIRAAVANWVEIYNANDWTRLAAQFTEDAVMMPPNSPAVVGRSAIARWEAANEDGFRIALLPEEITVTGDRAFVRGRSCVFIPLDGAKTGVDVGKFLEVRHRQSDGRWLISHDVFNSDLPAGGDLADSCPDEIANGILEGIDAENETKSSNPAVFSLSTLPRDVLGPLVTRQVVNGTQMTFSRWDLNKGARVPMHRHANEQISWIISGKAQVTSGGRTYILGPGNIMVFPPNVEHQVDILEDTVAADIFAPQRQDWIDQAAKAAGLSQQTCRIERAPGAINQCKGENQ